MKVQHVCLVEACTACHQFQAFEIPSGMSGQPGRIQSLKGKKDCFQNETDCYENGKSLSKKGHKCHKLIV